MKKTNIGIVIDFRFEDEEEGYSRYAYYAQRENIIKAFEETANVFLLPHDKSAIPMYIQIIDGIIFTGSKYHLDPFYYNEQKSFSSRTDNRRADFEFEMLRRALDKRIPVLGIAGGMQTINVFFGGSMYQNIAEQIKGGINHMQQGKGLRWHMTSHDNVILPDTMLAEIIGTEVLPVNSTHVQAIKNIGEGLQINALSKEDNVIEGIESKNREYWILGLEWRPEYVFSRENPQAEREKKIFDAFTKATDKHRKK